MKKLFVFCCLLIASIIVNAYFEVKINRDKVLMKSNQKHLKVPLQKKKLKIFLKLDDFDAKKGQSASLPAMDYLLGKKIKAAIGFIAIKCDQSTLSVYATYLNAKNDKGEPLFEVWNHGLDHINPEFDGKDYDYQKAHFEEADRLMKDLLRLQMHSFGAPFNRNDAITNIVIAENPNYKVTMFNNPADPKIGILNLNNRVNMEIATGKPNYEAFVKNYNNKKNSYLDNMVLQGHPKMWKTEELNQFTEIIDFLIAQGCEFDLPYSYYQGLNSKLSNTKLIQKINFESIAIKTLGDSDFVPEAKASFGSKVLYNSSNPEVAIIIDSKIHIIGEGNTIITASQPGDDKFLSADYVSHTLKVILKK
jgi:peptidoglycan/xylan/chitin deacetylase (PgdA/CDA1 family)